MLGMEQQRSKRTRETRIIGDGGNLLGEFALEYLDEYLELSMLPEKRGKNKKKKVSGKRGAIIEVSGGVMVKTAEYSIQKTKESAEEKSLIDYSSAKQRDTLENIYAKRKERPRWYNQSYLIYLALKKSENSTASRKEIINRAIALDKKMSSDLGITRAFSGKTPQNSASSVLTFNLDLYFIRTRPEGSKQYMYSLSYSPGDFNSSVGNYNAWMKTLIEVDWPVCFGSDHDNIPLAFKDKPPSKSSEEVESIRVYLNRKLDASTAVSTVDELNLIKTDTNAVCSVRIQKSGESHSESYLQRDKKVISNKGAVSAGNTDDVEVDFNIEHKGLSSTGSHKTPSLPVSFQNSLSKNKHDANELPLLVDVDNGVEIPGDGAAEIQRDFVEPKTCLPIPSCWQDIVRVSASNIPNAGNGLFAVRDLPAGVPLGFYFGVPIDENEYDLAKDHIGLASSYSIMYRKTVLDATDDNGLPFTDPNGPLFCPYHFMNEGGNISDCNISFLEGMVVNQIICFTTRLIKAGEELLVYYGSEVNRSKWECDT